MTSQSCFWFELRSRLLTLTPCQQDARCYFWFSRSASYTVTTGWAAQICSQEIALLCPFPLNMSFYPRNSGGRTKWWVGSNDPPVFFFTVGLRVNPYLCLTRPVHAWAKGTDLQRAARKGPREARGKHGGERTKVGCHQVSLGCIWQ